MLYPVLIRAEDTGFSATVPDLPGCTVEGMAMEEVEAKIPEAAARRILAIQEEGLPVPPPAGIESRLSRESYRPGTWILVDIDVPANPVKRVDDD